MSAQDGRRRAAPSLNFMKRIVCREVGTSIGNTPRELTRADEESLRESQCIVSAISVKMRHRYILGVRGYVVDSVGLRRCGVTRGGCVRGAGTVCSDVLRVPDACEAGSGDARGERPGGWSGVGSQLNLSFHGSIAAALREFAAAAPAALRDPHRFAAVS